MKSFAVMMACGVLALGACSSNSQPESSDNKNAGASPNTASAFRSDVAPDDDESPADGAIEGTFAVGNGRELYIACVGTGSPTVVL